MLDAARRPRPRRASASAGRSSDLDEAQAERARELVRRRARPAGGGCLARGAARRAWPTAASRSPGSAATTCSGTCRRPARSASGPPTATASSCFVLLDDWIPAPRRLDARGGAGRAGAALLPRPRPGHGQGPRAAGPAAPVREARAGLAAGPRPARGGDGRRHRVPHGPGDPRPAGRRPRRGRRRPPAPRLRRVRPRLRRPQRRRSPPSSPTGSSPAATACSGRRSCSGGRVVGTWRWTGRGAKRDRRPRRRSPSFSPTSPRPIPRLAAALA